MTDSIEKPEVTTASAEPECSTEPSPVAIAGSLLDRLAAPLLAYPLITFTGWLLFFLNAGGYPLYTKGEPREGVTVFDIVNGGGVILPMRAGVEIPSKPLLMHWIAALISVATGGVTEWSVRMPSALAAVAGMLVCYGYVRRLFDNRSGLIAALILGTTFQYLQAGTGARVDMTLTFFMEVAFFEFICIAEGLSPRTTLLYFAIAFAILTKGPIGAALPILVALIWLIVYRRWELISRLDLRRGAVIIGGLSGGWYLAAIFSGGLAFVRKQLLSENLTRIIPHGGASMPHVHPFYYEDLSLLAGFLPWTVIAVIAAVQFMRGSRRTDPRLGYLFIWFAAVLAFYNLPQSKRGVYLLALYPALAAIIAIQLNDAIGLRDRLARLASVFSRAIGGALLAIGAVGAIALIFLYLFPATIQALLRHFGIVIPEFTENLAAAVKFWRFCPPLIPALIAASGLYLLRARARLEGLCAALIVATSGLALAINLVIEPALASTLALKTFAAEARKITAGKIVGYFGNLDYDFAFYNGRDLILTTPLDPNGPALLVTPEDDWKLAPGNLKAEYKTLLRSNPTDLDGSGRMLLLERTGTSPATPKNSGSGREA
ncbi:MAG TPA: glycosyltransferase family 39 protein [Candidatus Binataceae bacterium]|nr:glycosyltransferase family 39 protein [Candidatus Binataceae bacterium]